MRNATLTYSCARRATLTAVVVLSVATACGQSSTEFAVGATGSEVANSATTTGRTEGSISSDPSVVSACDLVDPAVLESSIGTVSLGSAGPLRYEGGPVNNPKGTDEIYLGDPFLGLTVSVCFITAVSASAIATAGTPGDRAWQVVTVLGDSSNPIFASGGSDTASPCVDEFNGYTRVGPCGYGKDFGSQRLVVDFTTLTTTPAAAALASSGLRRLP
jgi:hypothetical protein